MNSSSSSSHSDPFSTQLTWSARSMTNTSLARSTAMGTTPSTIRSVNPCWSDRGWCEVPGDCWDHLDAFYNGSYATPFNCQSPNGPTVIYTWTYYSDISTSIGVGTAHGWTEKSTYYAPGGTIPIFTVTVTEPDNIYPVESRVTSIPTATWVHTETNGGGCQDPLFWKPNCQPPRDSIRCESQWENYLSGGYMTLKEPWCTFGSLSSQKCSDILTLLSGDFLGGVFTPRTPVTQGTVKESLIYYSPSETFAPGCTVGCGECSITGDRVKLLYWPPKTAMRNETRQGISTDVVAYIGGTTLTSPTLYVSYSTLFAMDSCSYIGPQTYSNTIIPIGSDMLSSLVYHSLTDLEGWQWDYQTASFNLSDLVKPIPQSIYDKQPVCQANDDVVCPSSGPYRPLIAIPQDITSMEPAWATCKPWYGGLFDPPSTLHRATIISTVTTPHASHTTQTPASPSSPIAWLPTQTASPPTSTLEPQSLQATATVTAGGKTFTAIRSGSRDISIIVDQTTAGLHSGVPENISGIMFSLQSSAVGIVVGTQTISFATETQNIVLSELTFVSNHQTFTVPMLQDPAHQDQSQIQDIVEIESTFVSNHETYTVLVFQASTSTPSNGQTELTIVSDHHTYTVLIPEDPNETSPSAMSITVGNQIIKENTESHYVIGSQTLEPSGSAITVDGTTYSLASDGTELYVNGKETSINPGTGENSFQTLSGQRTATTTGELSPSGGFVETQTPKNHKGAASTVELQCATLGLAIVLGLVAVL